MDIENISSVSSVWVKLSTTSASHRSRLLHLVTLARLLEQMVGPSVCPAPSAANDVSINT